MILPLPKQRLLPAAARSSSTTVPRYSSGISTGSGGGCVFVGGGCSSCLCGGMSGCCAFSCSCSGCCGSDGCANRSRSCSKARSGTVYIAERTAVSAAKPSHDCRTWSYKTAVDSTPGTAAAIKIPHTKLFLKAAVRLMYRLFLLCRPIF